MTLFFPSPEFDDAVAAVCHGTASEELMLALNVLLRSNAGARDEYLMRVELHARLASDRSLFPQAAEVTTLAEPPNANWGAKRNDFQPLRAAQRPTRTLARTLAYAAGLALIAAGVWGWWRRAVTRSGATSAAVAMLTRVDNARWGQSAKPPRVGGALDPGWLRLESGMAQVVFYSGARLVMEGPTELQLIAPMEAVCPIGRLLVEVPKPARGFRLKTAQLDLVDLGTAFGIEAADGRTEVDVFQGRVDFKAGTAAMQSLVGGLAVAVEGNAPAHLMEANPAGFTSMLELLKRSLAAEAVRYDQWRMDNARLNHDPSLLVHLELENLGDSDWTVPNSSARNRSTPDATIVGCQHAEGRWPEKQSLEFQSVNDRVRLAVPGEFESLTLSAWVRVKGLDRQFNSLLMCDGFEPGAIHWLIRKDGVLGLTVKGPGSRNAEIITSPPVMTLDKFGMWTHLAVVIDGKTRNVAQYVNGLSVSSHTLKLGPPYRIGPAELGNWSAGGGANAEPEILRNLSGSLDEFELFSRALTDAEVHELYTEGKPQPDS